MSKKGKSGTFALNKVEAFHRWYSYIEGYSSFLIEEELDLLKNENIHTIYDPFAGTGTTLLVASERGMKSFYSEINPFMCDVIDAKINSVLRLRESGVGTTYLRMFLDNIQNSHFQLSIDGPSWGGFENFFEIDVLTRIIGIQEQINKVKNEDSRRILLVALSSILVTSSKMVRRGDLRRALPTEKKPSDFDVVNNFKIKLEQIIDDIDSNMDLIKLKTERISFDARDINIENLFDCVITSPPYLNGTNYIRNTKLELKLTDHLITEKDLPKFHSRGIIAGINNVSSRNGVIQILPIVQPYIDELIPVSYDKRIAQMVAGYFSDMSSVIERLSHSLKDDGIFIMDIGDSQFAGVHIPTHDLLSKICEGFGFIKYDEEVIRKRISKNGMVLTQRLLKFRLKKNDLKDFKSQAERFIKEMPYKNPPYSGRNWGHNWHSLCSYHGKLKPSIAHFLISYFTEKNDVVLDPLSGVGTIPFEACLQGRVGIGNDLSELAYIVTKAKTEKPSLNEAMLVVDDLRNYIQENISTELINENDNPYQEFGYNGKLTEYFEKNTFKEILSARQYFLKRFEKLTGPEAIVFSAFLHVLHGNRPYALSRNSHPLTPYAPTGEFTYKNVVNHIIAKIELAYKENNFENYTVGKSILGDFKDIDLQNVDVIITSPPFADSMRFYMQNWMRLWLCGWEQADFKNADSIFLDQKQKNNFDIYESFFDMCYRVLKPNGKIILHLGKTKNVDMADELSKRASGFFDLIYRGCEDVSEIEKHGIKDKGSTFEHQYLFLQKKRQS